MFTLLKRCFLLLLLFTGLFYAALSAKPVLFENVFYAKSRGALLDGQFAVRARIVTGNTTLFDETLPSVVFKKGRFALLLGQTVDVPLPATVFNRVGLQLVVLSGPDTATFSFTAVPYALYSSVSEETIRFPADAIRGPFLTSKVFSEGVLVATPGASVLNKVYLQGRGLGVGLFPDSAYKVDVAGVVNATELYLNGLPLSEALAWKSLAPNLQGSINIYTIGNTVSGRVQPRSVGIGNVAPKFTLDIFSDVDSGGRLQARSFLKNGLPLTASLDWRRNGTLGIYYYNLDSLVGIGNSDPRAKLDVLGAMRVSTSDIGLPGSIRFTDLGRFEGFRQGIGWTPIGGINSLNDVNQSLVANVPNKLAIWGVPTFGSTPNTITQYATLSFDPVRSFMGVGLTPQTLPARLTIRDPRSSDRVPLFMVANSGNVNLFVVNVSGNVGIASQNPRQKLSINGFLDAGDFTVNGDPIRLVYSTKDFWQRMPTSRNIYYLPGNVGIGRPDPTSLLEIAQPNGAPNVDPGILFTSRSTGVQYILGVAVRSQGTFRINRGNRLGVGAPLFVAQADRFGLGVDDPVSNLTVSGNTGVLINGGRFDASATINVTGPGTRMQWNPSRAAFTLGRLDSTPASTAGAWDRVNLGLYTISMGHNQFVSGNLSAAVGGENNRAAGAYATAMGGASNEAIGDFSYAIGRQAVASRHGSFVWSDMDSTPFRAIAERQFLIRAKGGVGIGTNLTARTATGSFVVPSAFTVSRNALSDYIVRFTGDDRSKGVFVRSNGKVSLGGTYYSINRLVVSGNVGIGLTNVNAALAIRSFLPHAMSLQGVAGVASPSFFVGASSNVGIGVGMRANESFFPLDLFPLGPPKYYVQVASGSILADTYKLPDGEIGGRPPNYVWQFNRTTPNVYFVSGNVGIGTSRPQSMLTLSNLGALSVDGNLDPALSYDISSRIVYSAVVRASSPFVYRIVSGNLLTSPGVFTLSGNRVGIRSAVYPERLNIQGQTYIQGQLRVSTSAPNLTYKVDSGKAIAINRLFINGQAISFSGRSFAQYTTPPRLYYDTILDPQARLNSYVGIGTNHPNFPLEIVGTLSVRTSLGNSAFLRNLKVNSNLTMLNLKFWDQDLLGVYSSIFIRNSHFFIQQSSSLNSTVLSQTFVSGQGPSGNITGWSNAPNVATFSLLIKTGMNWVGKTAVASGSLGISGNVYVRPTVRTNSSFRYANSVALGTPNMAIFLDGYSAISHNGLLPNSRSLTGSKTFVSIDNWGALAPASRGVKLQGISVVMRQPQNVSFTRGGTAIGVNVDVSGVAVQTAGDVGHSYAALFKSDKTAKVGILCTPNTDLEVKGTVSANFFVISNRLTVTTLNVSNVMDMRTPNRIGVGKAAQATLDIAGQIQTDQIKSNWFVGKTFLSTPAAFTVGDGLVGLGTTTPNAQLHMRRIFYDTEAKDFYFSRIGVTLNVVGVTRKINPLEINLGSASVDNILGEIDGAVSHVGTGLSVNLSGLALDSVSGTLKGVGVKVPAQHYAAVFRGGNVGVGVTQPRYALDVAGTVMATNIGNANLYNQQEGASFNYLTITPPPPASLVSSRRPALLVTGPVVAQNIRVYRLYQTRLNVQTEIQQPHTRLTVLGALLANSLITTRSFASDMTFNHVATINKGVIRTMAVGGATLPSTGLSVLRGTTVKQLSVSQSIETLVVSANQNFVANASGVGLFKRTPDAAFDVVNPTPVRPFSPANNLTWNALKIQRSVVAANSAAGLVFIPNIAGRNDAGSGVAAVTSAALGADKSSALVFITDPQNDVSAERVRITPEGFLGIGTSIPQRKLTVAGDMRVASDLRILNRNTVVVMPVITFPGDLTVSASVFVVSGNVKISKETYHDRPVYLKPLQQPVSSPNYGLVYIEPVHNALLYSYKDTDGQFVTANLGATFSVTTRAFPYNGPDHKLAPSSSLFWNPSTVNGVSYGQFLLSSPNLTAIPNSYFSGYFAGTGAQAFTSDFSLSKVNVVFGDRTDRSSSKFKGISVVVNGGGLRSRLESAIGLKVDVSRIRAQSVSLGGQPVTGRLVAASFLTGTQSSGNVMISTSQTSEPLYPSASLHVISSISGHPAFQIHGFNDAVPSILIDPTGQVGLGTTTMGARFVVQARNGGTVEGLISVMNGSSAPLFSGTSEGFFGIGTTVPRVALEVFGTARFSRVGFKSFSPKSLFVSTANGGLTVTQTGLVGIGVTAPEAQLHLVQSYKSPNSIQRATTLESVSLAHTQDMINTKGGMTGVGIIATSDSRTIFGPDSDLNFSTYKGLNIDLKSAALSSSSKLVGLFVTASIPGVFKGGNVGIGTTLPAYTLDVAGSVQAVNVLANVNLDIDSAQLQSAYVVQNVLHMNSIYVSPNFNIGRRPAVSLRSMAVLGSLAPRKFVLGAAVKPILNAQNVLSKEALFPRMGIGTSNFVLSRALAVSGSVLITKSLYVSQNVWASSLGSNSPLVVSSNRFVLSPSSAKGVSVNGAVLGSLFQLPRITEPVDSTPYGTLYVFGASDQLRYKYGTSVIDLSSRGTGADRTIPYFDDAYSFVGNPLFMMTASSNYAGSVLSYPLLRIGTSNIAATIPSRFNIVGEVLPNMSAGFDSNKTTLFFKSRTNATASSFKGVNVGLTGNNMKSTDLSYGLVVDVSTLRENSSTQLPSAEDHLISGKKYAATFLAGSDADGTVFISTIPASGIIIPSADFHLQSKKDDHIPFLVSGFSPYTAGKYPELLSMSTASDLQVYTSSNIRARLLVGSLGSDPFRMTIQKSNDVPIFTLTSTQSVGIGTTRPKAFLYVQGDGTHDIFRVTSNVIVNKDGLVGIGFTRPQSKLHLSYQSIIAAQQSPVFRVDVLVATVPSRSMIINRYGNVGIASNGHEKFPLLVSGMTFSGNSTSNLGATYLPTNLRTSPSGPLLKGFFAQTQDSFAFMGLKQANARMGPSIVWGKSHDLIFESGITEPSLEVMRITGSGLVGIGVTNPTRATLNIQSRVGEAVLQIDNPKFPTRSIYITAVGKMGIGTSNPRAELAVNGLVMAASVIDEPVLGTTVTAPDVVVSSNVAYNPTANFIVKKVVTVNQPSVAENVSVQFKADVSNEVRGVSVVVRGDVTSRTPAVIPAKNFYGLKVKIPSYFSIDDPTFRELKGYKNAARFEGGTVAIGKMPTASVVTDSVGNVIRSVPFLQVYAMNNKGDTNISTGNIVGFVSRGGPSLNITSLGQRIATSSIAPDAFVAGGLSLALSRSVYLDLHKKNLIVTTNFDRYAPATAPAPLTRDTYTNSALTANQLKAVKSILAQNTIKTVYRILAKNKPSSTINNNSIFLLSGATWDRTQPSSTLQVGRVGFGFPSLENSSVIASNKVLSAIDKPLVVSGDIRVGVTVNASALGASAIGNQILFSGGPLASLDSDSENSDILSIARYNNSTQRSSDLRVTIGETNFLAPSSKFVVGNVKGDGTLDIVTSNLVVHVTGYVDQAVLAQALLLNPNASLPPAVVGHVGMGTARPESVLHVAGAATGSGVGGKDIMRIENTSPGSAGNPVNSLAIYMSASTLDTSSNFISFMTPVYNSSGVSQSGYLPSDKNMTLSGAKRLVGAIEMSDDKKNMQYSSSQADYAEYMEKQDPAEKILPGDVVGLVNGRVTHSLKGAQQVMVMSSAPIVLGNWTPTANQTRALVAFMGQVAVRVDGSAQNGDFIVASERMDGTAIAVSPDKILSSQLDKVVGRALESASRKTVGFVNTLIGFPYAVHAMSGQLTKLREMTASVDDLSRDNRALESYYSQKLAERQQMIDQLKAKVSSVRK